MQELKDYVDGDHDVESNLIRGVHNMKESFFLKEEADRMQIDGIVEDKFILMDLIQYRQLYVHVIEWTSNYG